MRACVRACVCACVRVGVRACVRACVRVCVCVLADEDIYFYVRCSLGPCGNVSTTSVLFSFHWQPLMRAIAFSYLS